MTKQLLNPYSIGRINRQQRHMLGDKPLEMIGNGEIYTSTRKEMIGHFLYNLNIHGAIYKHLKTSVHWSVGVQVSAITLRASHSLPHIAFCNLQVPCPESNFRKSNRYGN